MKEKVQDILLRIANGGSMLWVLLWIFCLFRLQVTAGGVSGVSTVLYYLS